MSNSTTGTYSDSSNSSSGHFGKSDAMNSWSHRANKRAPGTTGESVVSSGLMGAGSGGTHQRSWARGLVHGSTSSSHAVHSPQLHKAHSSALNMAGHDAMKAGAPSLTKRLSGGLPAAGFPVGGVVVTRSARNMLVFVGLLIFNLHHLQRHLLPPPPSPSAHGDGGANDGAAAAGRMPPRSVHRRTSQAANGTVKGPYQPHRQHHYPSGIEPPAVMDKNPVCLVGWYGRNCNQIITLGNALRYATVTYGVNVPIGLPKKWSEWFEEWFEPHPRIVTFVNGNSCRESRVTAEQMYWYKPINETNPAICSFRLKQHYFDAAQSALFDYDVARRQRRRERLKQLPGHRLDHDEEHRPLVSVHRRFFEGKCHSMHRKKHYFCLTDQNHTYACDWELPNFVESSDPALDYEGDDIVLFTDWQVPRLDKTFFAIDDHSFQVQIAMMTLTDVHYGNPTSSVDYVVSHWRSGNMLPSDCYQQHALCTDFVPATSREIAPQSGSETSSATAETQR